MIKAIETVYRGYRFRSRTEARWAVFFDAMGWKWEYEVEGYELPDGQRYLPDFVVGIPNYAEDAISRGPFLFEVKPPGGDISKVKAFVKASGKDLCVVEGQPSLTPWKMLTWETGYPFVYETLAMWSANRKFWFVHDEEDFADLQCFGEVFCRSRVPELYEAIEAARAVRFEFDERKVGL